MNMTPEQIKDRTKKIAEENEKFNDLLNACEEKLGLDIENGGNSGKKKKHSKKKQSASAEDKNFLSPRDIMNIKYGETCSYEEIASRIGKSSAQRAVGKANGDNRLAIVVPCHRVIRQNGELSGYGGGVRRKEWLLQHEKAVLLAGMNPEATDVD